MKNTEQSFYANNQMHRHFVIAITTLIIALLMYVLSSRIDREALNLELAQFEFRLAEIRAAVVLKEAALVAKNQMALAGEYEGTNPMDWMKESSHYLGEMSLEAAAGQTGKWVYDPSRQVIAYQFINKEFMQEKIKSDSNWLQFKVFALWSKEKNIKEAKGLVLRKIDEKK